MQIVGKKEKIAHMMWRIEQIASSNKAFQMIWNALSPMDITAVVGTEQDLIDDIHNTSKTLHEFRGYYLNKTIHLFDTRYETEESLTYAFLHELCHIVIQSNPYTILMLQVIAGQFLIDNDYNIDISTNFWNQKSYEEIIKSNAIHDQLPEEKLCDDFATALIGYRYNRAWWQSRWESQD